MCALKDEQRRGSFDLPLIASSSHTSQSTWSGSEGSCSHPSTPDMTKRSTLQSCSSISLDSADQSPATNFEAKSYEVLRKVGVRRTCDRAGFKIPPEYLIVTDVGLVPRNMAFFYLATGHQVWDWSLKSGKRYAEVTVEALERAALGGRKTSAAEKRMLLWRTIPSKYLSHDGKRLSGGRWKCRTRKEWTEDMVSQPGIGLCGSTRIIRIMTHQPTRQSELSHSFSWYLQSCKEREETHLQARSPNPGQHLAIKPLQAPIHYADMNLHQKCGEVRESRLRAFSSIRIARMYSGHLSWEIEDLEDATGVESDSLLQGDRHERRALFDGWELQRCVRPLFHEPGNRSLTPHGSGSSSKRRYSTGMVKDDFISN